MTVKYDVLLAYGIDVSDHQNPSVVPYGAVDFLIVKATEGATFRAHRCIEHVARARAADKTVGLYHFYRHGVPFGEQIQNFLNMARDVGLGADDIVPCLDIEQGPYPALPSNAWNHPCEAIAQAFEDRFGGCIVYVNKRDFALMLSPAWVLERPLWWAQYGEHPSPPVDPVIWQHRVGPFEYDGAPGVHEPRSIDQNRLLQDMPLIEDRPDTSEVLARVYSAEYQEMLEKIGAETSASTPASKKT